MHFYSDEAETVIHSADAFAPVGYLRFTNTHTENKDSVSQTSMSNSSQIRSMLFNSPSIILQAKVWAALGLITLNLLLGQNKYENKTLWRLLTLSKRGETQRCRAGFRSTSRGPFELTLTQSCSWSFPSSLAHAPLAPHGLLWRLQYSLQPETRPSLINMSAHIKALCIQVAG